MSNLHGGCGRGSPPVGASPSIPQPLCEETHQGRCSGNAEPSHPSINAGAPLFSFVLNSTRRRP
jgi:hypothetical protein